MPSLQVITLGCSKNTVDTEHLLYQVQGRYDLVPEGEDRPVDVLLVNTCGFIGDAKEQSIETILAAVKRKQAGGAGKVLVFGCLSQRYADELPELIPEVDGWFGARELDPLVRALGCEPDPAAAWRSAMPPNCPGRSRRWTPGSAPATFRPSCATWACSPVRRSPAA